MRAAAEEGMMARDPARVARAAQYFYDLHKEGRDLPPLPPEIRPADLDEAYAIQEAFVDRLEPERGPVAGHKIAVITKVMQELMGIDRPCAGAIFARTVHRSPAVLRHADYTRPAVECEIAVRLGADLPARDRPWDRASVADRVGSLHAAIEIIEDHNADYKATDALGLIANNAWNLGCVLGPPVADWRRLDIPAITGAMLINGTEIGRGQGRDVMGHPFEGVAWLANAMAWRGRPLRAGMVLLTGSVVATQWPKPGDEVTVCFDDLGEASARFG
jgi:2-keto-4-pentenoate hydratase